MSTRRTSTIRRGGIRGLPEGLLLAGLALLLGACSTVPVIPDSGKLSGEEGPGLAVDHTPLLSPEHWLPAQASVILRVERPRAILDAEGDPVGAEVWKLLEELIPPDVWTTAAERLELSRRDLILQLFGQELLLCDLQAEGRRRAVFFSRSRPSLLRRLPEALSLEPRRVGRPLPGWQLDESVGEEDAFLMGRAGPWLALTGTSGEPHLRAIVTARAEGRGVLADDPAFRALKKRLPARADAWVYSRDADGGDRHALALDYRGEHLEAHYVARSEEFNRYLDPLDEIEEPGFGPLPDPVLLAATISLVVRDIPGKDALDLLVFPADFRDDVLVHLRAPITFFVGKLEIPEGEPRPEFTLPVLGLAVRLKNPEVASLLDRLISRVHFLLSMGRLDVVEGLFGGTSVERKGLSYRIADFREILAEGRGNLLTRLARLPEAPFVTRVAHGRVGDHWVVATNREFLHRFQSALEGSVSRLEGARDYSEFDLRERKGLIASVIIRGEQLSSYLKGLRQDVRRRLSPEELEATRSPDRQERKKKDERNQLDRPLTWLARGFENRRVVSLQVWRAGKGFIQGRLRSLP